MAKRKFTTAGETAEKTKWNKAKTRKWKMTYELVEVKPPRKRKAKKAKAAADSAPEKATPKPRKAKRKATPKRKTTPKRRTKAAG